MESGKSGKWEFAKHHSIFSKAVTKIKVFFDPVLIKLLPSASDLASWWLLFVCAWFGIFFFFLICPVNACHTVPSHVEFPWRTCRQFGFAYPIPTSWSAVLSMRTELFWLEIFVLGDPWWSRWGDFLLLQTDPKHSLLAVQGRLWKKLRVPQTSWKDFEGSVPTATEHTWDTRFFFPSFISWIFLNKNLNRLPRVKRIQKWILDHEINGAWICSTCSLLLLDIMLYSSNYALWIIFYAWQYLRFLLSRHI